MRRILAVALVLSGLAAGQGVKIPTYKELKYPTLGQVKIPEPVQTTLSNGMRLFLLENHELPLVSGSVMIHTGNLFDPADKKGQSWRRSCAPAAQRPRPAINWTWSSKT